MKTTLFLLTFALLSGWAGLAGSAAFNPEPTATARSADDKKLAAPAETKPAESKPAEKPTEKPAEITPPASKPPASKPAETKPVAAKMPAVIEIKPIPDADNSCIICHTTPDSWDPKDPSQYKFYIPADSIKNDLHWRKGLRCQDCHGGDPTMLDPKAHQAKDDFHTVNRDGRLSPADVPDFCGRCHSNIEYMRHFNPSPRTDQLAEYWTSGHGKHLKKGDVNVATCISCHDQPHGDAIDRKPHGIRPVNEPASPVYHTKVAETCKKCHSDKELMKGRMYNGKPLLCDEYDNWKKSVHGKALLEKGDLSAPTCNNCHGNHGAAPPQMDSVANACGACHGKIAALFSQTKMRHKFEAVGLPGCAACHGNHEIRQPSDDFLGMKQGAFCIRCHEPGKEKYGATLAGAQAAEAIHAGLAQLKNGILHADETLAEAERKGMEVSEPKFNLQKASDALTNARTQVHSFKVDVVKKALGDGESVVKEVQGKADHALEEYQYRRYWLAVSLVPILIVIGLLVLYIRVLPIPEKPADASDES
jgi:predicted CXXCH cytochrome family protein